MGYLEGRFNFLLSAIKIDLSGILFYVLGKEESKEFHKLRIKSSLKNKKTH